MSQFIEVPVVLTKEQYRQIVPLFGSVNERIINPSPSVGPFASRTLRFVTFAGQLKKADRQFHGLQRFLPLESADESAATFSSADAAIIFNQE